MKNHKYLYILSPTLIIIALILGLSFKTAIARSSNISVTGSAKRDFISDTIVWESIFSTKKMELKDAYTQLDKDREIITEYLISNNISKSEFVFSAIDISKHFENITDSDGIRMREFKGFVLKQTVKIESNAVDKIELISRDITSLIDSGVQIQSQSPYYFYSKLSDLKIDMIAEATEDAKLRASKIASSSGSSLGNLLNAKMGVFQIIATNSTENYSWGGTHNKTSKHKTATVTMKLSYDIGL